MICRLCGCDDDHACFAPEFGACSWVAEELCSHCEYFAFTRGPRVWARLECDELLPLYPPVPITAFGPEFRALLEVHR